MTAHPTITHALSAVMADVQAVGKTGRNESQDYSFRGVDAVVNAVGPALRAHGVVPLPRVLATHFDVVEVGQRRTPMRHVTLELEVTFVGPAGDHLVASALGEAMDSGDKAAAKAHSVAYRTLLLQTLAIPTDEPDPDEASYERSPAPPAATADQVAAVRAYLDALDDDQQAAVRQWWTDQGMPSLRSGRLTEDQAAAVLAELESRTPTNEEEVNRAP